MRRPRVLLAVPVLAFLVAGCSGSGSDGADGDSSADADQLLSQAQDTFADAGSVSVELTSDGVPKDANGVSGANGDGVIDADTPKFQGTITGRVQGVTGEIDIIAIGDQTWMKFFTPGYNEIDMATLGAPNPAMLFHPENGIPGLIASTTDVAAGEQKREGKDVITEVTGVLPGGEIEDLLKLGDVSSEFDVTYGITEDGELRTAVLSGEFYPDEESTYTFVVTDYGKSVEISEP